jgi:superfamily II DNA helicase RecQ
VNHSEESKKLFEKVVHRHFQIIYISLEMLIGTDKWRSILLNDEYQTCLKSVVIDEAHCVIKWGEQFHTTFKQLGELCCIVPSNVNMMALTATAAIILRKEICRILGMTNSFLVEMFQTDVMFF